MDQKNIKKSPVKDVNDRREERRSERNDERRNERSASFSTRRNNDSTDANPPANQADPVDLNQAILLEDLSTDDADEEMQDLSLNNVPIINVSDESPEAATGTSAQGSEDSQAEPGTSGSTQQHRLTVDECVDIADVFRDYRRRSNSEPVRPEHRRSSLIVKRYPDEKSPGREPPPKKVEIVKHNCSIIEEENSSLLEEISALQSNLSTVESQNQDLTNRLSESQQENQRLAEENARLRAMIADENEQVPATAPPAPSTPPPAPATPPLAPATPPPVHATPPPSARARRPSTGSSPAYQSPVKRKKGERTTEASRLREYSQNIGRPLSMKQLLEPQMRLRDRKKFKVCYKGMC